MKNPLLIVAVVGVAAVAGFVAYRELTPTTHSEPAPAAPIAMASSAPEVLPDFELADRSGQMRSIRSWPGQSMIVNFWATWCAPCRREIPLLNALQREHGADGFQVVGVAVDFRDAVIAYADEIGIDYPLLIGEEDGLDAVNAFGVAAVGFPFTAFTARDGRIVTMHLGELTAGEAEVILEAVSAVNQGALTVLEARTRVANQLKALSRAGEVS
jgi:thiol-disulfide isomerase/thioredoxin